MKTHSPRSSVALAVLASLLCACTKDKEPVRAEPVPVAPAVAAPSPSASAAPVESVEPAEVAVDASYLAPIALDAGLTSREDGELASILARLDAPCSSQAVSIAQCVAERRACPDCARAARYLAGGVHQGWPAQYVQAAYAARFDPRQANSDLAIDGSPVLGPATAPITIIEFGSYLCPHCAAEAPKLDAIQKAHPKQIRLSFKPIWSPQNAVQMRVTRAALAAAAQGKFWEMHATLFANQPKFDDASIDGYAKSVGLDVAKLHADMASPAVEERMAKDLAAATAAKIDGIPAIWINGHPYLTFEDLESRVAFELSK
jgi:protein-disulfide isomerase